MKTIAIFFALATSSAMSMDVPMAWDYPPNEIGSIDSFRLYQASGNGQFQFVSSVRGTNGAPPPLSTVTTGLSEGTAYTFRMTAVGKDGTESAPSNECTYIPKSSLGKLDMSKGQLSISGQAGNVYVLEVSTDLKNWTPLPQFTAPTDSFTVTIPRPYMKMKQAFFRMKKVSGPVASNAPTVKWTESLAIDGKWHVPLAPSVELMPANNFIEENEMKNNKHRVDDMS